MKHPDDWTFNESFAWEENLAELRDEFDSLKLLLQTLSHIEGLSYEPIDDIPSNLGLELFFDSRKVAELFCFDDCDVIKPGIYCVYSEKHNFEYREYDIAACAKHFRSFIK